ncbi:apolipoprotein A-IV-like [Heteronotia binoei]|uniref:apolipoprotein A-IV-like n=1 Tax=Heteronotia binoei TaxID=13085 RepID=UPI00292E57C0|nr:apolipoprotein A-IV-like [Heteronotia binoei]XP_060113550.1 apolipoprotein A-IV-like [Heteronotia binoei]
MVRNMDGVRQAKKQVYEIFWNGTQPFKKLVKEMPREVLETADLAIGIPAGVGEKLLHAIKDFTRRLEPAFRDLYNAMEPAVASHAEQAIERVRPHTAMIQARMQELSQNHGERLKARMHELESLMPQITHILSQIQQVQGALQPYVNEMHDTVRQKVEGAANMARPYVQPVLEKAKEYTKDFKSNPFFVIDDEQ